MSDAKDYLPEIPKDPSAAPPSSSRRFTRGASDKGEQQQHQSSSSSQRQKDRQRQQLQQQNTGYVDVIDKLDFSGLNMSCESSQNGYSDRRSGRVHVRARARARLRYANNKGVWEFGCYRERSCEHQHSTWLMHIVSAPCL
jgi:hypothetical protein